MDTETVTIPFNREAEEALLGAALIDSGKIPFIDLNPNEFYIVRHGWVWRSMKALNDRGMSVDLITLCEELDRAGRLQEVGGMAYLAGLVNVVPTSLNISDYAEIVRDYAGRRQTLQVANDLAKAAYDYKRPLSEAQSRAVDQLTMAARPKSATVHISVAVSEVYEETEERRKAPVEHWGIPTGFADFDNATGGIQRGEVLYIAGEPGVGKSILADQMGFNMGRFGYSGVIYSLEMKRRQITRRLLSADARVVTRKIKSGKIDDEEWSRFVHSCEVMAEYPIFINDDSNLTTSAMRADLALLKKFHNISWFVLDYLLLMGDGDELDETMRSAIISRRVKNMAGEFELAGITVNSVTKDAMGEDAKISQKNLRGSGSTLHDADLIGFLTPHQPEKGQKPDKNLRTWVFGKGRELEESFKGFFHLKKFDGFPTFANYTPERDQYGR
jgi:replicative DNA helicase